MTDAELQFKLLKIIVAAIGRLDGIEPANLSQAIRDAAKPHGLSGGREITLLHELATAAFPPKH